MGEDGIYVYRLQPTRLEMLSVGPTPEEAAIRQQHFLYLKDLCERGVVLHAGRTLTADARTFGIVILRAPSEDAARAIMESDPGVARGLQRAELFPYRIALSATPPG